MDIKKTMRTRRILSPAEEDDQTYQFAKLVNSIGIDKALEQMNLDLLFDEDIPVLFEDNHEG
jgi:hypothetical protein